MSVRVICSRRASSNPPPEVVETILTRAQTALYSLNNTLDLAAIETAAGRIADAGMVYAFGSGGNSSMIAGEIANRLFRLGVRVTHSADHSMQLMLAAAVKPGDVVIASSLSGRNAELARALRVAREYKGDNDCSVAAKNAFVAEAADAHPANRSSKRAPISCGRPRCVMLF